MPKFNKTPAHHPRTGLQGEMPKAPGHAEAGQPPRREEAGGELPRWLDSSKAKWTKERVAAHFKKGAGAPQVQSGSQLPDIPPHLVRSSVKEPKRAY